jgi:hypothetical protein
MKISSAIGILLFVFAAFPVFSQDNSPVVDPILIRLQAKIISAADSAAVPYVNIINNRTHSGTITNSKGYFTLEMLNIDSLVVSSVGYGKKVIKIPPGYMGYEVLTYVIQPVNYALSEIKVQGDKPTVDLGLETGKPVNIDPELRGDAFNERPPVLAALFSPISFWQYYLSKKEKRKRKVREAMAIQRNWEMHSQNYNKEMVMKLTGLNEIQADTFMVWFNSQNILPYTSTEYQVRASIIEYYRLYQLERNLD